jgi:hypothetical protein
MGERPNRDAIGAGGSHGSDALQGDAARHFYQSLLLDQCYGTSDQVWSHVIQQNNIRLSCERLPDLREGFYLNNNRKCARATGMCQSAGPFNRSSSVLKKGQMVVFDQNPVTQ